MPERGDSGQHADARRMAKFGGALIGLLAVLVALPAPASADGDPALDPSAVLSAAGAAGDLEVTSTLGGEGGAVVVRVSNTGDGPVAGVELTVDAPDGVSADPRRITIPTLSPGTAELHTITLAGEPRESPAAVLIRGTGKTAAGGTAAVAAVELDPAAPPATIELVGNTRLTDASPAELVAVVSSSADSDIVLTLVAEAGAHEVRLAAPGDDVTEAEPGASVRVDVPARGTAVIDVRVDALERLRRGSVPLVVTGTVDAGDSGPRRDVTASEQLDVALSADVLSGILGIGTLLIVPGLVAVWLFVAIRQWDRRRIGLSTASASARIWEEKSLLLVAGAVSILGASAYLVLGGANLLDSYSWLDLLAVTVGTAVVAAAVAGGSLWLHRRKVAVVSSSTAKLDVLRAAAKHDDAVLRPVFVDASGRKGLLVHDDGGAKVLAPQVVYTEVDGVSRTRSLVQALARINEVPSAVDDLQYLRSEAYVAGPVAVPGAVQTQETAPILVFQDAPP